MFAEEIEPTGCVPMELVLERYRHAALQSNKMQGINNNNNNNQQAIMIQNAPEIDKRLQPRLSLNLFPGSIILRNERMHLQSSLNGFYGNLKQSWRLVFRASTNGFSAASFHRHCDGIAPLMVVAVVSFELKFSRFHLNF